LYLPVSKTNILTIKWFTHNHPDGWIAIARHDAHLLDAPHSSPIQLPLSLADIGVADGDITRSALDDPVGYLFTAYLLKVCTSSSTL
jgi:hypothetical protein